MNILKTFKSFEEGIEELTNAIPNVREFIGGVFNEKNVIEHLSRKVGESYPSIYNPEYPATCALSISAQELNFKSRGFYSFGWRVNPTNGEYSFRVTFGSVDSLVKQNTVKELTINGWVVKDKQEKK